MLKWFLGIFNRFLFDITTLILAIIVTFPLIILGWFGADALELAQKISDWHDKIFDWKILRKESVDHYDHKEY